MAHALVHILGSRAGYTTLDATAGLSTADRAELEVLGFGDASGSDAMARLESEASMVGRRLRSGRFAISRMLPGGTDDKGRPTIEVVSLVLDARGYASVVGALARLAQDVRFWRLARGAVARGYELPEEPSSASAREKGVLRAFDAWSAAREQGAIAVLPTGDASALLSMIGLLHAKDLDDCRWGVGVLSLSAPVDLCTLAPSTAAIGARPVLRAATGDAWLRPEMLSVVEFVEQNPLLPPREALASAVRIDPALDRAASTRRYEATPREYEAPARVPARPKSNLTAIAAVCAVVSVALFVFTAAMYARDGRRVNVEVAPAPAPAAAPNQQPAVGATDGRTAIAAQGYPDLAQGGANPEGAGAQHGKNESVTSPPPANTGNVAPAAPTQPESPSAPPPSQPARKQTPEEEHSCAPGTRWVQLYVNEDHDSLGESLSDRTECVLLGDKKAIEELWESGFALDSGDECPRNELRQKKGDCGCDWWEPWTQDERSACEGDEDRDGESNLSDKVDDRVGARERMRDCFRRAKEAADTANNWLNDARKLDIQTKGKQTLLCVICWRTICARSSIWLKRVWATVFSTSPTQRARLTSTLELS